MALRTTSGFSKGMITDVVGADDSVYTLKDAYIRRASEIVSRGRVVHINNSITTGGASGYAGITQMCFHPDIGTLMNVGITNSTGQQLKNSVNHQIFAAPLQSTSVLYDVEPALFWTRITESTGNINVFINSAGSTVPMDWIQNMETVQSEIILSGRNGRLYKWGGSTKASYGTGKVKIATATPTIISATSTATDWGANIEPGMYIMIEGVNSRSIGGTAYERSFRITNVIDGGAGVDVLEINAPVNITASVSAANYKVVPISMIVSPSGVWNSTDDTPRSLGPMCIHNGRVWIGSPSDNSSDYNTVYQFNRLRWSGRVGDPGETLDTGTSTALAAQYGNYSGYDLWHTGGYVDIDPVGGAIRGLVSLGNQLVIIKSNALYRLVGSPTLDYQYSSEIAISKIVDGVGANGDYAYGLCKAGLIIASQNGLFLYNGEQIKSLTLGRIQRWWEDHFRNAALAVVVYDDKVIVSTYGNTTSSPLALIWQIEDDYFWTADLTSSNNSTERILCGAATFTSTDEYVGDYAGSTLMAANPNVIATKILTHINHKSVDGAGNFVKDKSSNISMIDSSPSPKIVTNAIPLGANQASEGRVNTVYIAGVCNSSNASDSTVSILTGLTSGGDVNQANEGVNTLTTLSYGMDNDGLDRMHRIPCDGIDQSPAAKISIGGDATASAFRVYSISIDSIESNVVS